MKQKTLEEVIKDLRNQCDIKASAVAEILEDMRYNVETKDFTPLDCADEVSDMGEWGKYAANQLRGSKSKPTPGQVISFLLSALANVAEMDPKMEDEELRESRLKHIAAAKAAIKKVKSGNI